MASKRQYSPEGLRRLRAAARRVRPWEHSTGPRTPEGKTRSSKNATKHGLTSTLRGLAATRVDIDRWLRGLDLDETREDVRAALDEMALSPAS